jgi:penicillin amidase
VPATGPPSTRRSGARLLRLAGAVAAAALLVLAGGATWAWWAARSALPQLDGKAVVPGLSARVRVVRDERGVPTIEAATLEDLFLAQGYVTAQDRLWQMDMLRRAAAGELAEVVGPAAVGVDREERILGLRVAAETAEASLSARDRATFDAYARGVNAFIASQRDRLPVEFRLLGYSPRPWTVTDSLLIGARMVQDLNHQSDPPALTREKVLAKLGPELTTDLYVNSSWRDRPPGEDRHDAEPDAVAVTRGDGADTRGRVDATDTSSGWAGDPSGAALGDADGDARAGSNDWVVSGQHTVTGKPLLSNDMHLNHRMPNLWFAAHLECGSFDVAGVTIPGLPFVIVGHNRRIGWGFTNLGPTVEDLYVEEFNAQGQVRTPAGWVAARHRTETIHVKGQPDVVVDVVTTRHGPIITALLPGETRQIALRWTLYDGMGLSFLDLDSAQNWEEFREALSTFIAPGQNVVYADVDGNIGYQATGHVPIRAAGDGSLPVSGSDDAHEWTGFVPFDDLPRVFDPPSGILATANGRIVPDGYRYPISTEWGSPWRTARIYQVLESAKRLAPADMLALQMDVSSAYDRFCASQFVAALDHAPTLSVRARQAADILRRWDGRMSADAAAPTIETRARDELMRLLLEPKLGPAPAARAPRGNGGLSWRSYRWAMSSVWLENVLRWRPARWLPPGFPDYDAVMAAAVERAVDRHDVPSDLTHWMWGASYQVEIDHPVLSRLPLVGRFTGPGAHPLSGGAFTVKAVRRTFGPSERLTWDFADFDDSTLNLVTGESGVILSPNYMDQWAAWYGGTTFALPFSQSAVARHRTHEMALLPR